MLSLGFLQTILFTLYVVFVDCIFCGMIVATLLWVIANRYFRDRNSDFDMEWGYAFDVHLNAFFPPLILLHFIQLFFYHPLISRDWFISTFIGNTIWLLALGYYIYITFLGYNGTCVRVRMVRRLLTSFRYTFSCPVAEKYANNSRNTTASVFVLRRDVNYRMEFECVPDVLLSLSSVVNNKVPYLQGCCALRYYKKRVATIVGWW